MSRKDPKTAVRTVKVTVSSYQPSKAELEADVSIDASPKEVARALMSTVNVQRASSVASRPRKPHKK